MTTPNLQLSELSASQAQPHLTVNSTLRRLDGLVQLSVISTTNTPPGSPVDGDRYICGTSPTGAWAGHANDVALYIGTGWVFSEPEDGWLAFDQAVGGFVYFDLGAWGELATGGGGGSPTPDTASTADPFRRMSETLTSSALDPTDLTFTLKRKLRPIDLLPATLKLHRDDFELNASGLYSTQGTATPGYTGARVTVTTSGANGVRLYTPDTFEAPFLTVRTRCVGKGAGATYNVLQVGLIKDADNWLLAEWDFNADQVRISRRLSATTTDLAAVSLAEPSGEFNFAFVLNKNEASAWYDSGTGWQRITSVDLSTVDLRDPAVLATYHPTFGAASGGTTSAWAFDWFEYGYFGQLGLRDVTLVTHKDGAPYTVGGDLFFTATAAGYAGAGGGGHTGVYAINLKTGVLRKTGALFVRRGAPLIYNDLPANIIYDDDIQAWRVFIATFGNGFGSTLQILHQIYRGEILNGVTVLRDAAALALTEDAAEDVYDPCVVFDPVAQEWLVAYAATTDTNFAGDPMYVALDSSTDLVTFTSEWQKSANTGFEGAKIQKVDGSYYVVSASKTTFRVYDRAGTYLNDLNVGTHPASATPPHATLIPLFDGDETRWFLICHDDTKFGANDFSWGSLLLYEAAERGTGFEFDAHGVT